MKRLLLVLIIFVVLLCGCNGHFYYTENDGGGHEGINVPTKDKILANENTMKYHLPSCRYATDPSLVEFYNEDFLIERGYTACKICFTDKK